MDIKMHAPMIECLLLIQGFRSILQHLVMYTTSCNAGKYTSYVPCTLGILSIHVLVPNKQLWFPTVLSGLKSITECCKILLIECSTDHISFHVYRLNKQHAYYSKGNISKRQWYNCLWKWREIIKNDQVKLAHKPMKYLKSDHACWITICHALYLGGPPWVG